MFRQTTLSAGEIAPKAAGKTWRLIPGLVVILSSTAATAATAPIFFFDAGYVGNSVTLSVGQYNRAALTAKGIPDNSISSVQVPRGFKVEAFDTSEPTGTPTIIVSADTSDLAARGFDNTRSAESSATV